MEQDVVEAEAKFMEEHKDEIEAAQKFEEQEKQKKDDEYGEEEEDEEKEKVPKEKPVMPVFNKEEYLQKWLEDNPVIEIPPPVVDDKDSDWYMTEEEEEALINAYF
jgi:HrpA-like RNA helicase